MENEELTPTERAIYDAWERDVAIKKEEIENLKLVNIDLANRLMKAEDLCNGCYICRAAKDFKPKESNGQK